MKKFTLILVLPFFLAACSTPTPAPTLAPTPDARATETRIAANIFATQTASVPTATTTPTTTPTPLATNTVTITLTPLPSATATQTNTPRPLPTVPPPPEFTFQWNNPFYECRKQLTGGDGTVYRGARQFQITIVIKNMSEDKTLSAPWKPSRWVITNGGATRQDTLVWQWTAPNQSGKFTIPPQPNLSPGVLSEWTFLAFPLQADEWMDHLEWDLFGRTYSSPNFGPGEFRNNYHYMPCPQ